MDIFSDFSREELAALIMAERAEHSRKERELNRQLNRERQAHAETRARLDRTKQSYEAFKEGSFQAQMQLKALQRQVEALRSGAKYEDLRRQYERDLRRKTALLKDARHQLHDAEQRIIRMRKEWAAVFEMLAKEKLEHEKACAKSIEAAWAAARASEREAEKSREKARTETKRRYEAEVSLAEQTAKTNALQRRLDMDFETSGIPSSAQEFKPGKRKRIPNNRPKTDKKRGGQPGRKGVTLMPRTGNDVEEVWLELPSEITDNPDWYETDKIVTKQVLDFEIRVRKIDYKSKVWRSRKTGSRRRAKFPAGVENPANYGPTLKAAVVYLSEICNVAVDKIRDLINELSEGELNISEGFVARQCRQFVKRTTPELQAAYARIQNGTPEEREREQHSVHIDSTGYAAEGEQNCVTVCATDDTAYYTFTEKKGHEAVKAAPVGQCNFDGYLTHDDDPTFFNYAPQDKHQLCCIHLLRKLKDSTTYEPERTWNKPFCDLLRFMIHTRKQQDMELTAEQIEYITRSYDDLAALGQQEYEYEPPDESYLEGRKTLNELARRKQHVLNCLDKPWLSHENNLAERLLRPVKRHTRAAVTNRSREEARIYCACLTVLKTAELRKQRLLPVIREIMTRPVPRSEASAATQFGAAASQKEAT